METLVHVLTLIHIATGVISLFAAPVAMAVSKGGKVHRAAGKVFFYGMAVTSLTALVTGYWHGKYFLMMISFFSFHLIASGYRSLFLKSLHRGIRPTFLDKVLHGSALVVNLGLLIWGLSMMILKVKGSMFHVFIAFGLIGTLFAWAQIRKFYKNNVDKRQWFYDHIAGFLAGYIAALSAFSVNILIDYISMPIWLAWTWPTLLGTPIIFLWIKYYKKRISAGRKIRDMVKEIKLNPDKS